MNGRAGSIPGAYARCTRCDAPFRALQVESRGWVVLCQSCAERTWRALLLLLFALAVVFAMASISG